ncbi:VOC family protein [Sinimarinibacterium sp. NLF-5-8]|uniref:VOC family protein n=1 Tax=Sinimarinibacterium sp. NLF-5-8 TaxID=2698684 RepID=UPI00137BF1EF|nr:VOC family protein [Sinimarinibacterium sp. NLF-5-8]QHS10075.1 VOC family protein [Sinimarinibacterium sp. NLF-5-8]
MIGYTTVGTHNLEKAGAFYDALLADYGAKRFMDTARIIVWFAQPGTPGFSVCLPFDGQPASIGNGVMVALAAKDRAQVDAIYAKAISLGATDEGAPGERMPGFYAGYFRDLDGNKLNVFFMG